MARGLYRFYLYAVSSALLIFAAIATSQLLGILLTLTPLRGSSSSTPDRVALVQALVFAIVAWLISGILGGLHYWLIRRDMRNDPAAATSGVRSFFLNMLEALGLLFAVAYIGFGVIEAWAHFGGTNVAWGTANGLTTLAVVGLLELERRRASLQRGAALVFQRLHFFGTQMILLFFVATAFLSELPLLVNLLFFRSSLCGSSDCSSYNLLGLGLTPLWFTACWLVYGLVTHTDTSRTVRIVLHGASLAFGIGYVLSGVFSVLQQFLQPLFHIAPDNVFARYTFIAPLLLGLLVTAIYHWLLRDVSQRGLIETQTRRLTEWAIAGLLLAGTFWLGVGYMLYNLFERQAVIDGQAWINVLALLITGASYIPLDLYLRRRYVLNPANSTGPRRGFVLALLGTGLLALAIGGAATLYAWGTALLGSPIGNGSEITHNGLAATIVGAVMVGIYLWTARSEHLFTRGTNTDQPPAPTTPIMPVTPAVPFTAEMILDELLAGRISRDEAATRLRRAFGR
ncbi:MAG: DUF5671 domain-containing protein [Ktedonobacteraceae bacterium]